MGLTWSKNVNSGCSSSGSGEGCSTTEVVKSNHAEEVAPVRFVRSSGSGEGCSTTEVVKPNHAEEVAPVRFVRSSGSGEGCSTTEVVKSNHAEEVAPVRFVRSSSGSGDSCSITDMVKKKCHTVEVEPGRFVRKCEIWGQILKDCPGRPIETVEYKKQSTEESAEPPASGFRWLPIDRRAEFLNGVPSAERANRPQGHIPNWYAEDFQVDL